MGASYSRRSEPVVTQNSTDDQSTRGGDLRGDASGRIRPLETDPLGRIPLRIRIGVTGHRHLPDEEVLRSKVGDVLRTILALAAAPPNVPVALTVVSSLAEGADRLVAQEVLCHPEATLVVPLPLEVDDYLQDFSPSESRDEFYHLLERSEAKVNAPSFTTRQEGYEWAGQYVVEHADVVIALWDGKRAHGRGGTAEIVNYAKRAGVPVYWIDTLRDHAVRRQGPEPELEAFNYNRAHPARIEKDVDVLRESLVRKGGAQSAPARSLDDVGAWAFPYYVRADLLALRYQRLYLLFSDATFYLAAAAVATIAIQVIFFPAQTQIVWFEVFWLLGLIAVLAVLVKWRPNHKWTLYRSLAERFRSLLFLALVDTRHHPTALEEWRDFAVTAVWRQRPKIRVSDQDVRWLKALLDDAWIGDQRRYHESKTRQYKTHHDRFTRALFAIIAITVIAAFTHSVGLGGHSSFFVRLATLASFALPALGGALAGIREVREYRRNSERYKLVAAQLKEQELALRNATDLHAVRTAAERAANVLDSESRDWFGLMRLQEVEAHV